MLSVQTTIEWISWISTANRSSTRKMSSTYSVFISCNFNRADWWYGLCEIALSPLTSVLNSLKDPLYVVCSSSVLIFSSAIFPQKPKGVAGEAYYRRSIWQFHRKVSETFLFLHQQLNCLGSSNLCANIVCILFWCVECWTMPCSAAAIHQYIYKYRYGDHTWIMIYGQ